MLLLLLAGCNDEHSVLAPATPQAWQVETLWWIFAGVCAVVYLAVLGFLFAAVRRAPKSETAPPFVRDERRLVRHVTMATAFTAAILVGLLVADFFTHRALPAIDTANALTIKLTGHQWWWQVEYQDAVPANIVQTANEIHLPLGRPVNFLLQSSDVIHSFWLPNFLGKKDLVPGHPGSIWFQPDRLGTFRGQCAEFCGFQHAHMGLLAVVESPRDFARWQEQQRKSANEPADDHQRRGRDLFVTRSCVLCHTIAGTTAASRVGPPLTHFGSQQTFAAGSFPLTRDNVIAWVRDPQAMKPGVRMPATPLSDDERAAIVDYLLALK